MTCARVVALAARVRELERENDRLIAAKEVVFEKPIVDPATAERVRELEAALRMVDEPYPIEVFPDLQQRDEVFAAMRAVNKYATEQFHAEVARQRGSVVRALAGVSE